jgi:hypothetical protein
MSKEQKLQVALIGVIFMLLFTCTGTLLLINKHLQNDKTTIQKQATR